MTNQNLKNLLEAYIGSNEPEVREYYANEIETQFCKIENEFYKCLNTWEDYLELVRNGQ